jgi:2-polyprenyl-3-methyl-5-hydroxy-6-metoxy-1,4-benzoquinol methylase
VHVRLRALLRLVVSPIADLTSLVPEGARVFDIGCGTGAFLALLARTRSPVALYGSDRNPAAVASASAVLRSLHEPCPFHIFRLDEATRAEVFGECDVVSLIDVLHHVPPSEQQEFIVRIASAMGPGALLLLKDIDRSHAAGAWANRIHDRIFSGEAGHEQTAATLEDWLTGAGLRIELRRDEWCLWYPHITFLARKSGAEAK